ncbi:MAG: hypothetical protein PHQ52_01995 [Candidatus Omnitrophica bacterium]|nr:hypothetical protein [Candidatus Omnitrophota bacterium]
MSKYFLAVILVLFYLFFSHNSLAEDGPHVKFSFVEFFPEPTLRAGSYFEVVFRLKNDGNKPINPYAEVAVSGEIVKIVEDKQKTDGSQTSMVDQSFETKEEVVLRLLDKKYKLYNLWPGEISSKLWFYIGILPEGSYTMRIYISALDRVRGKTISSETYEMGIFVKA